MTSGNPTTCRCKSVCSMQIRTSTWSIPMQRSSAKTVEWQTPSWKFFPAGVKLRLPAWLCGNVTFSSAQPAGEKPSVRAGGFDVNIRGAEDFDLWLSMAEQGSRFLYHSRPLVRYRFRPDSLSSDSPALLNTVLALYKKHLARPELLVPDRNAIAEAIRRTQAELDLYLGKQALQSSNIDVAIERLASANGVFHRSKLSAVVWMLRLAPGLASKYIQRQRNDSQKKPVVKPVSKS